MRFNNDVHLFGIRPELAAILFIIDLIYNDVVNNEATITSLTEYTSQHGRGSLHYSGAAIDLRTRNNNTPTQWHIDIKKELVQKLKLRLTTEFDVILESDHIHLEFQPKN